MVSFEALTKEKTCAVKGDNFDFFGVTEMGEVEVDSAVLRGRR